MRERLRSETGIVLVVAIEVLAVALLLAAAAVGVAISTNDVTNHDVNSKQAVQAADAGARVATYRLSQVEPLPTACPTEPTQAAVGASGLCPMDGPESLGNGSSFEYWISAALPSGGTCAGVSVYNPAGAVEQRCVTALGTANGVSARIQERVAAYTSTPVFPTAIFGTKSVTIANNDTINADVPGTPALIGTNGVLTVSNNAQIDGYALPPQASVQISNNVTNNGPTTGISSAYPVPTSINPGTTAQNTSAPYDTPSTFQGGTCSEPTTWSAPPWVQTNCDYRINCPTVTSCDPHTGSVSFNATTRTLSMSNNASLTLGGGFYNFCSMSVSNNSSIYVAPGARVSIFIDSPQDHGACPIGTSGAFTLSNNVGMNAGGSALNLQVYVYGDPSDNPPTNAVSVSNNSGNAYTIAAPFSNVTISNNGTYKGAIVGYTVTLVNNSAFLYESDASTLQSGSLESFYRSYWEQCGGLGTPSAPTAGC